MVKIMRKFIVLIMLFSGYYAHASELNCDNTGKIDATDCLQKLIDSASKDNTELSIKAGKYIITNSINLYSTLTVNGHGVILIPRFNNPNTAVFVGNNVNNLAINGFTIYDNGYLSESKIISKYDNSKFTIGFSNSDIAIRLGGKLSNIIIESNFITGFNRGLMIYNSGERKNNNIAIQNNTFNNIGASAIDLEYVDNAHVLKNNIYNILGNNVENKAPVLSDSKFGDGIYLRGIINSVFVGNNISNFIRGGIVFEGDWNKATDSVLVANNNIDVSNNKITLAQLSRGTEENGGIWVEGHQDKTGRRIVKTESINIHDNYIDNFGAKPGAHSQYGITCGASKANLYNNRITNFTDVHGYGIACSDLCKISDNVLINNSINLAVYKLGNFVQLPYQESSTIVSKFLK